MIKFLHQMIQEKDQWHGEYLIYQTNARLEIVNVEDQRKEKRQKTQDI